jgi:uncharacterized protein (TIGR02246 family)
LVGIAAKRADVPRAARETIAKANADWLVAMKRGDAAATVEPYADDAVFVTATGEAVRGRAAIEQLMRERFAKSGNALDGRIIEDGLTREGSLIYEWGHATLQLSGAGQPTRGRYLTVWASDSRGRWQIVRNLSLPD